MTSRRVASSLSAHVFQSAHFTANIQHKTSSFTERWHTELRFNWINLLRLLTYCSRAANLKVAYQNYTARRGSWRARGVHRLPLRVQKWSAADSRTPQNKRFPFFPSNKRAASSYLSAPWRRIYILPVRVWSLPSVTQPTLVIQIRLFQQSVSLNGEKSGPNSGGLLSPHYTAADKPDA